MRGNEAFLTENTSNCEWHLELIQEFTQSFYFFKFYNYSCHIFKYYLNYKSGFLGDARFLFTKQNSSFSLNMHNKMGKRCVTEEKNRKQHKTGGGSKNTDTPRSMELSKRFILLASEFPLHLEIPNLL